VREWRAARGLPVHPLQELRDSGYVEKITRERESKNSKSVSSYA
jgi:L-rhamnose isomerase/sugar isomerase